MCGIAGTIGADHIDHGRIERTLNKMARRGPDARGSYQTVLGNVHATMLHTRLAIIDLDNRANQPFIRDEMVLVFNGEIYNYIEIAKELRLLGHKLETRSDTEVLLESYRAWGMDAFDKFEGMWAFALLDKRRNELILSRDRFGEKPLFYMICNGTFYFASEPKALATLLGKKLQVNQRHVRRYLVNGFRSLFKSSETFFEHVSEVPPASNIIVSHDGKTQKRKYWTLKHHLEEELARVIEYLLDHPEEIELRAKSMRKTAKQELIWWDQRIANEIQLLENIAVG